MKPGEKVITRMKSKDGKRKFAVTVSAEKPDPEAIFLTDDDLEHDGD